MIGSDICVNCSMISSDCLFLMKQAEHGLLYALRFTRHSPGLVSIAPSTYYHLHLSKIVIIGVEIQIAFKLGVINRSWLGVGGPYLVYHFVQ